MSMRRSVRPMSRGPGSSETIRKPSSPVKALIPVPSVPPPVSFRTTSTPDLPTCSFQSLSSSSWPLPCFWHAAFAPGIMSNRECTKSGAVRALNLEKQLSALTPTETFTESSKPRRTTYPSSSPRTRRVSRKPKGSDFWQIDY